jgi:hypothetical protein
VCMAPSTLIVVFTTVGMHHAPVLRHSIRTDQVQGYIFYSYCASTVEERGARGCCGLRVLSRGQVTHIIGTTLVVALVSKLKR